jgi:hypothetical protein
MCKGYDFVQAGFYELLNVTYRVESYFRLLSQQGFDDITRELIEEVLEQVVVILVAHVVENIPSKSKCHNKNEEGKKRGTYPRFWSVKAGDMDLARRKSTRSESHPS